MGAKQSKQLMGPKRKVKSRAHFADRNPTQVSTIWELFLPECVKGNGCCWQKKPEKKNGKMGKVLTLEDQFSSSPSFKPASMRGGELCVLKQSSKRVHPSSISTNNNGAHERDDAKLSKASVSFSLETLVLLDRKADDYWCNSMGSSSVSRRTSIGRKSSKKVSFRPPEENDVYLFYSPEELSMGK